MAAVAITDKIKAETLYEYTMQIIDGLHSKDIWPVSYACDGTDKERVNQGLLRKRAHSTDTRRIPAPPHTNIEGIELKIPFFFGRPIALVQDSLHARKTARNNLESGATFLVLGNEVAHYKQLRDIAFSADSPIYHRDVENTDKQDDRAAARIFSALTLAWLVTHRKDNLGLIAYLFVFGEMISAIQHRSLPFTVRVQMIARAWFFVKIWQRFLAAAGYNSKMACISRQFLQITEIVVHGFFELLIIHRDYFDGFRVPLLLWLHSSEMCEHVFAECRKQMKDFEFASFLLMIPRAHWYIRHTMHLNKITKADAKERAAGYAHTWTDTDGISLSNLSAYPDVEHICKLAAQGYEEASDLWHQLGVFADALKPCKPLKTPRGSNKGGNVTASMFIDAAEPDSDDSDSTASDSDDSDSSDLDSGDSHAEHADGEEKLVLPSISSWCKDLELEHFADNEKRIQDGKLAALGIGDTARAILDRLLDQDRTLEETGPIRLDQVDKTMRHIECAKVFLDLETSLRM